MAAMHIQIALIRSEMPCERFLRFTPPIDRSRCLANALRQIYEKGSFEQF